MLRPASIQRPVNCRSNEYGTKFFLDPVSFYYGSVLVAKQTVMKRIQAISVFLASILLVSQGCDSGSSDAPSSRKASVAGDIETIAGLGPSNFGYSGDDGPATAAKLGYVTGITSDHSDNIFITDGGSNTVRRINAADATIQTISGVFLGINAIDPTPYYGDGDFASLAHVNMPLSVAVDDAGNVVVADGGNHAVRYINSATQKISSVAGDGISGYTGDDGPAVDAQLWTPYSVVLDDDGNIYIADAGNNVVRKITKSTGKIETIAGLGPDQQGYTGDNGSARDAKLHTPQAVAVDGSGNVYISDAGNNVVRKISGGTITTLAGTGLAGYTGDGALATQAKLSSPKGIAIDDEGNIYIADSGNSVVRKIDATSGLISTAAGTGVEGYTGDGGAAISAKLSNPSGVALDSEGNLYIADTGNNVIRKVLTP